jgi:hypothetical protein
VTKPPVPNSTSFKSSVVDTMVNTVSQAARSSLLSTSVAPYSTSGSALLRVRFQISTPCPAFVRRLTMASPMRPNPIQPTLFAMCFSS